MDVLDRSSSFERVLFARDDAAGLRAIIAIHSTRLGPSLGGCRIQPYASEGEALDDVLRLAESMTWKAAAAGLDLGGGKSVILAHPARDKSEALLRAFGRAVESLGGRYITAVDVGSSTSDMDEIRKETRHVAGVSEFNGGIGDPSSFTARGILGAMRACVHEVFRADTLKGRRVAIQGVGKVGYHLAGGCIQDGADVVVADPNLDNLARVVSDFSVTTCTPDEILEVDCDILAPSALGGALNEKTIPHLACPIVCGSANNQLADPEDGDRLRRRGILYAPDFIVNAGGLIAVADELQGFSPARAGARVDRIGRTLLDVLHLAAHSERSTADAAVSYAKERIDTISSLGGR